VKCRARVSLAFDDAATAEAVRASLAPDDGGFIASRAEGAMLVAQAEAADPLSLLRTLDDWLASAALAEKAARAGKGP